MLKQIRLAQVRQGNTEAKEVMRPFNRIRFGRSDWIILLFGLFVANFLGMWTINDAFAGILAFGVDGAAVGNGFLWYSPVQAFHIGMWFSILSTVAIILVAIHNTLKEGGTECR